MRVLHVAMECIPFSKVGGMADVTGALPAVLEELGIESRVMTPYYPQIYKGPLGREIAAFDVWVGSAAHRVRLFETEPHGILVDQPTAFDRPGVYDDPGSGQGFSDNLFRCLVLCQAARAAIRQGVFAADVVHCHDSHTAFVPVYLKDDGGPPSVFTIHNLAYQGIYGPQDFWLTGLVP
jgi:starch synthase